MATLDGLPGNQRAIIELAVRGGHSYEEVSGMLGMPASRVRDLAREALSALAPGVDAEWRPQVADYLLGQQSGNESEATRERLERSESARTWALSVIDSLDALYGDGARPAIPEPRAGRPEDSPGPTSVRPREPSATRRRRPASVITVAAVVGAGVVAVLLAWFLLPGGGEQQGAGSTPPQGPAPDARAGTIFMATGDLRSVGGTEGRGAVGVLRRGGPPLLVADARVEPIGRDEAYVLWLYNTREDAVAVGVVEEFAPGVYQGFGQLPADYGRFRFVDLTREGREVLTAPRPTHSGRSVLRGPLRPGSSGIEQGLRLPRP